MPDLTVVISQSPTKASLRVPVGHGDFVHPVFWPIAVALLVIAWSGTPLGHPAMITAATILMIGGGLPHGAYDIALLKRTATLGRSGLVLAVAAYIAIVGLMALLWIGLPLLALILFLAVAAIHFGEDWPMLDVPLLRFAAGAAVIAAPTIGHSSDVSVLFVAMSDQRAAVVAQIITAAAPVTLLVTSVGIFAAWRIGSRQWAAAMAICLALLLILPPVAGFALFFVFLHAPRHLRQARTTLIEMKRARWLATGALFSGVAIVGWWAQQQLVPREIDEVLAAQAFQLLAAVAVPHLVLSRWLQKRL